MAMFWRVIAPFLSLLMFAACGNGVQAPQGGSPMTSPTSTSTTTASPDSRIYTGNGFSFAYPESWTAAQPATGLVEVVIGAPRESEVNGSLPNINLVIEPLRIDLDTEGYFEASKQTISSGFNDFSFIAEGRTTISGEAARWMDYRWVNDD
jgi:hypothetical protein